MVDIFLRAKHWQIFLWTLVIPIVGGFAILISILLLGGVKVVSDPTFFRGFLIIIALLMGLSAFSLYGWVWSMERGIHPLVPDELKLKPISFNVSFIFGLTYVLFIFLVLFTMGFIFLPEPMIDEAASKTIQSIFATFFPLMLIFHLLAMLSTAYCFYHAAKTIKLAEKKRLLTFWDYAGEFFMIMFFHFGVWVLQPKLNALYERDSNTSNMDFPEV